MMDRIHADTKERTRDFKLDYLANILRAVEEQDSNMLWRLARGLLDLADEFFDDVDRQLEILAKAKDCAHLAKIAAPGHMLPNKWMILVSYVLQNLDVWSAIKVSCIGTNCWMHKPTLRFAPQEIWREPKRKEPGQRLML